MFGVVFLCWLIVGVGFFVFFESVEYVVVYEVVVEGFCVYFDELGFC